MIHKKKEHIGDYEIEIDSYYKLLSSMYLKKNDLPNAALCLKKVFYSFIIHKISFYYFFDSKCIEIEQMNYGSTSKIVKATMESFENLKK